MEGHADDHTDAPGAADDQQHRDGELDRDTYRATYTEHLVAREGAMGSGGISRWKFSFTSQQTGQVFRVELVNKWTQNANGEWVVDRGSFEGDCYI